MRPQRLAAPDGDLVDALVTDRYLDAVLAGGDRHAAGADGELDAAAPDPPIRHAADVVRASLVRVHPSFRFEERLAARLAELAAASSATRAAGAGTPGRAASPRTSLVPFPASPRPTADPLLAAVLDGRLDPADPDAVARAVEAVARAEGPRSPARPLLVGGAITSAALSLVGVAWVAWRASRSGATGLRGGPA